MTAPLALLFLFAGSDVTPQLPPPFQISVNVDLVVLPATVHDRHGRIVPGLSQGDFEIYEDGALQSIRLFRHEDLPVTVGLVIDHSASMIQKLPDVIAAARMFIGSSSPADEMFVVNFNEHADLGLPDAIPFSNRPDELAGAVSNKSTVGMTALYDAIVKALQHLETGHHDKKVLIVISDGGDNASNHNLDEVLKVCVRSGDLVYTIGIFDADDLDRNPKVLSRLAEVTGGEAFFPHRLDQVVEICGRIARDIRNQYTLGYVSSQGAKPGAFRSVRVTAHSDGKEKLLVRTRSGYVKDEAK